MQTMIYEMVILYFNDTLNLVPLFEGKTIVYYQLIIQLKSGIVKIMNDHIVSNNTHKYLTWNHGDTLSQISKIMYLLLFLVIYYSSLMSTSTGHKNIFLNGRYKEEVYMMQS